MSAANPAVEAEQRISMTAAHVWHLLADERAQQRWLGRGTYLSPRTNSRVHLAHEAGHWASGSVIGVESGTSVRIEYRIDGFVLRVQLTVSPIDDRSCNVRAVHEFPEDLEPRVAADARQFWAVALDRLKSLANRITARRKAPRQAVIVIHGIGEQEPGETLQRFVEGVFGEETDTGPRFVKPDAMSGSFELRRVNVKATPDNSRPTTDVYELYWAHLVNDTTTSQVAAWATHLLLRRHAPRHLRIVQAFVGLLVLGGIAWGTALLVGALPTWARAAGGISVLVTVLGISWKLVGRGAVISSLGDAARYLAPRPANIAHRQAIREAGVGLLRTLHASGQFDRIVVVGHSLGSVIAYDILRYYWIEVHQDHARLPNVANGPVQTAESTLAKQLRGETIDAPKAQHDTWEALRDNGVPWLVTDLVTLGSPLSMADFLMARSKADFSRAREERLLPTCPPVTEDTEVGELVHKRMSSEASYIERLAGAPTTMTQFHHAALFAATRWTNLHFRTRLLRGDPIGGPVGPLFGSWVHDVPLRAPRRRAFLHTRYWTRGSGEANPEAHIKKLHDAIGLDSGRRLRKRMALHSPLLYLDNLEVG